MPIRNYIAHTIRCMGLGTQALAGFGVAFTIVAASAAYLGCAKCSLNTQNAAAAAAGVAWAHCIHLYILHITYTRREAIENCANIADNIVPLATCS